MALKVDKPWGYYNQFSMNKTCSVKLIYVDAGQETSLHWHNLRSDSWVILDPDLEVQVGDTQHQTEPGEEIFIPAGQLHRITSTGGGGRVLEIAFGYSDEEDTHRLADDYGREMEV